MRWGVAEPDSRMLLFRGIMRVCEQAFIALPLIILSLKLTGKFTEIYIHVSTFTASFCCPVTLSEIQAGHIPKSHEYASVEVEGLSDVKN